MLDHPFSRVMTTQEEFDIAILRMAQQGIKQAEWRRRGRVVT